MTDSRHRKIIEPIKSWPSYDRPSVKLKERGAKALTDSELVAVLLGYGSRDENAMDIARNLLKRFGTLSMIESANIDEVCKVKGLKESKSIMLKAALEIGRRFIGESSYVKPAPFNTSEDIARYFMPSFKNLSKEVFKIGLLNVKNQVIKSATIAEGGLTSTSIRPAEILNMALKEGGVNGIILLHNHPSLDPAPSVSDIELTNKLAQACKMLGIVLVDHLIFADTRWYSFNDNNLISHGK